jgi:hypothetical protein
MDGGVSACLSHLVARHIFSDAEKIGLKTARQVFQLPRPHVLIKNNDSDLVDILAIIGRAMKLAAYPVKEFRAIRFVYPFEFGLTAISDLRYDLVICHGVPPL